MKSTPDDTAAILQATLPGLDPEAARAEAAFMEHHGIDLLCRRTGSLPPGLMECPDAPAALFRLGTCELSGRHNVAVVGTRNATVTGQEFCRRFIGELAERCPDAVIVSGLAYGIDVCAHRAALDAGLATVAVMAHGLDTIYPADHRDIARRIVESGRGAIVSEYTSGARVHRSNFLARNRIVAALSAAVVVVESASHGGALYTANLAGRYARTLFAVPGRWCDRASQGCNSLIASGKAHLLTDADTFLRRMGWECKPARSAAAEAPTLDFSDLAGNARLIVDYLRRYPDRSQSDIASDLALPAAEVAARLMELEMDDVLTLLPGGRISLNV